MNIGFFTDTYYPQLNGVTISIDNFTRELRKKGHTVYIIAPKIRGFKDTDKDVFRIRSFKIISSEPEVLMPIILPENSIRAVFGLDLDIIHAHGNGAFSFLGYQVAKAKDVPFVMTFHNLHTKYTHYVFDGKLIKPGMVATGLRLFGNLCNSVVVPSEKMKREVVRFGVTKPMLVINNFIVTKRFENIKKGYLHELLGLHEDIPLLLTVGRLGKEKNFTFLIKMFSKLVKNEKASHLVIVGQGTEEENLKDLVNELNLQKRVHFTGRIDSQVMPKVYADATIFVFSSTSETQGLCVLEAAASGLPIVAAKDLAYQGIVVDGEDGYLLPLNQRVFAKYIASLLRRPEKLKQFGKKASELAEIYSEPDRIVNNLVDFYVDTLKRFHGNSTLKKYASQLSLVKFVNLTQRLQRFFTT